MVHFAISVKKINDFIIMIIIKCADDTANLLQTSVFAVNVQTGQCHQHID